MVLDSIILSTLAHFSQFDHLMEAPISAPLHLLNSNSLNITVLPAPLLSHRPASGIVILGSLVQSDVACWGCKSCGTEDSLLI